jgi:hypothetical protein
MIMSCRVLSGPKHARFFAGRAQSAGLFDHNDYLESPYEYSCKGDAALVAARSGCRIDLAAKGADF